jgi:hypothetical protein
MKLSLSIAASLILAAIVLGSSLHKTHLYPALLLGC